MNYSSAEVWKVCFRQGLEIDAEKEQISVGETLAFTAKALGKEGVKSAGYVEGADSGYRCRV